MNKLWGYAFVAGVTAASVAMVCCKRSRDILLSVAKSLGQAYGSARRSVTSRINGDWKCEEADIYYGFNHGLLYVTDRRGFEAQDWHKGSYNLYKNTENEADGYTMEMTYDGKTKEYGFRPLDEDTVVFTDSQGKEFVFTSIKH